MTVHLALTRFPDVLAVACNAHKLDFLTEIRRPRSTSPRLVTCGNCKRTRRYREAQIEKVKP